MTILVYLTVEPPSRGTMNLSYVSAIATSVIVALFFLLYGVSSVRERQPRAALLSFGMFVIVVLPLAGGFMWWHPPDSVVSLATVVVWVLGLLYFLPLNRPTPIVVSAITDQVDERNGIFAREEYRPGSNKYEKYYRERPQLKEVDDRLRRLPELLEPGGRYYNPEQSPQIKTVFRTIQALTTQVDGEVGCCKTSKDPTTMTSEIKQMVHEMGADEVGITRLNPMFVYSHVGRGPESWGKPIELDHQLAIVFTLEMNYDQVRKAPDLPITEESARQYLRAANISIDLARHIRSLGYPARAHISGSNYQIMLPPVAHDAGLGELSRMGYLVSQKYGPRVRLGGVTTDLPLVLDHPIVFGVQDFCVVCLKCAEICPSAAIPRGGKTLIRGVEKWQLNVEQCSWYWRVAGTDCGLCMKVCPYSHPPTLVHNLVRYGIRHSTFARQVSVWGENLFYGRGGTVDAL